MKDSGACDIENAVIALEEAIKNRKKQMRFAQDQSASSNLGQISPFLEQGEEFANNFIKKAQKSVEDSPWDVLRKVAIYSFGIGLFLSLRHRKSPAGEKE